MNQYLKETYFFDFTDPSIQTLVEEFKDLTPREQIAGLFLKVRDGWRYNPYTIYTDKKYYRASFIASKNEGHCIDKSSLFIAGLRALGIPARLRLAKVVNHIAVERLTEKLGTAYIAPHGIAEVKVDGKWLKASNAFNKTLCDKYNVEALAFDGSQDAIFQAFNRDQNKFMEYLEDYGHFEDVPHEFILHTFKVSYPKVYKMFVGQQKFTI